MVVSEQMRDSGNEVVLICVRYAVFCDCKKWVILSGR